MARMGTAVGVVAGVVLATTFGAPVIIVAAASIGVSIAVGVFIDGIDTAIHPDGGTWKDQFKDYLGELTE